MTKPLIVYVSGAPGSGKTTLAKLLSEQLYIPHVSSDLIHGGVALSHPKHDREETLLEVFIPTMIEMSQKGINFVVDQVLQKGVSEANIIDKLRPHAEIINIHTVCTDPIGRYVQRIKDSKQPNIIARREHLLERADYHMKNLGKTNQPLELQLPQLVVQTDDGYEPDLSAIISFIQSNHQK